MTGTMTHEQRLELVDRLYRCDGETWIDEGSWDDLSAGTRAAVEEISSPRFRVAARADIAVWRISEDVLEAIGDEYLRGEVCR